MLLGHLSESSRLAAENWVDMGSTCSVLVSVLMYLTSGKKNLGTTICRFMPFWSCSNLHKENARPEGMNQQIVFPRFSYLK